MITDTIDGFILDTDEDGFYLILSGEKAEYRFNVQAVADEILKQAWREIGPWWNEGRLARAEYKPQLTEPSPYEIRDPKHPDHYSTFADMGGP